MNFSCYDDVCWKHTPIYISIIPKQKIGKLLVDHAEQWAKKQGIIKLAVNTGKRRVDSHHFYRGRGFDDTGAGFYKSI